MSAAMAAEVEAGVGAEEDVTASHLAPSSIHVFTAATWLALSAAPCAGIDGFSSPATRRYMRLCSALPGTMSEPCSPPLRALSRVRRSNFESCMVSPWQFQQL